MVRLVPPVVLAFAVWAFAGCATARNYTDPTGPVATGRGGIAPATLGDLRVVTFNIKHAKQIDRAIELLLLPGPLRQPDVLTLQEMDASGTERIAAALALNYVYIPSAIHPSTGRDFGVAILSPWPLDEPRKVPMPHQHRFRKLQRAAAAATLRLPTGPVRVYALHLESGFGLGGDDRREQALAVLADLEAWPGPVIMAGDFNGRGAAREAANAGLTWVSERVTNTAARFDFDHVLARGFCLANKDAAGAVDDTTKSSDHEPVWVVLRPCGKEPTPD